MKHLSHEDIQRYLDDEPGPDNAEIIDHLKGCAACRDSVSGYGQLYISLRDKESIRLSPAFTDNVMAKLPAKSPFTFWKKYMNTILIILGFTIGLIITTQYMDLSRVGSETVNSLLPSIDIQQTAEKGVFTKPSAGLLADYKIVIFGLLGLIFAAAADFLVFKRKTGKSGLKLVSCY